MQKRSPADRCDACGHGGMALNEFDNLVCEDCGEGWPIRVRTLRDMMVEYLRPTPVWT